MRVKRGVMVKKRHKKILSLTKGYRHGRKNLIKRAKEALLKAGTNAYRDRKNKKREFRGLWIIRINAALKEYNLSYSKFIKGLKDKKIELDRKVLSELAAKYPDEFKKIVEKVKG